MKRCWMGGVFVAVSLTLLCTPAIAEPPTDEQVGRWERVLASETADAIEIKAAMERVVALSSERSLPVVRRLLSGVYPAPRRRGAELAGRMRAKSLFFMLFENRRDRDETVRCASIRAMAQVCANDPALQDRAKSALIEFVDDGNAEALHALAGLLDAGLLDEDVLDRLTNSEMHRRLIDDHVGKSRAYRTGIGRRRYLSDRKRVISALLDSKSWRVRDAVLIAVTDLLQSAKSLAPYESWKASIHQRLEDESPAVRSRALGVLSAAADRGASVVDLFVPLLRDPDFTVRTHAFHVASSFGERAAVVDEMLRALRDSDVRVQAAAAWLLRDAPRDRKDVQAALEERLDHRSETVRANAMAALMERGEMRPAFVPVVVDGVSQAAVPMPFPGPRGLGFGRRKFDLSFPRFSPDAAWNRRMLERLGPTAVPALLAKLEDATPDERRRWIYALGYAGPEGRKALAGLTMSGGDVRERALTLVWFGANTPELIDVLIASLDDSDASQRDVLALERIGVAAVPSLIALMKQAEANENGYLPGSYSGAESALSRIGALAKPLIEKAAQDPETGHRFQSLLDQMK